VCHAHTAVTLRALYSECPRCCCAQHVYCHCQQPLTHVLLLAALLETCRLEVNEHGRAGLDKNARDELERRRQEVASTAGTTREADTTKISERPDVVKKDKLNVVEQVVPVIERDVYIPHRGKL
jgi:hypothetical protein